MDILIKMEKFVINDFWLIFLDIFYEWVYGYLKICLYINVYIDIYKFGMYVNMYFILNILD